MFTGIVHDKYRVAKVERREGMMHLEVSLGEAMTEGLERGASVSVAGTCLTAVEIGAGRVRFDIIGETLARTTLGELSEGDEVNIERAARFGDEIGGHSVAGHVTGVGELIGVETPENNCVLTIRVEPDQMKYIFHKGYIALDGASLTIAAVDRGVGTFEVHLIPETLTRTTFGTRRVGDLINVEVDPQTVAIVDTVEATLARRGILPSGGEQ